MFVTVVLVTCPYLMLTPFLAPLANP
jgi:hypothetical protein